MNYGETISAMDGAFSGKLRPTAFIRGTCSCIEHNETMSKFRHNDLPIDALNNPGIQYASRRMKHSDIYCPAWFVCCSTTRKTTLVSYYFT